MRRLAMFNNLHASEILEEIFIDVERRTVCGTDGSPFEQALYKRLKRFEVNSRETYENFYKVLSGEDVK